MQQGEFSRRGSPWGANTVVCIWLSGSKAGEEKGQKWTDEEKEGMAGL